MNLKFIKANLIIFEIISIGLSSLTLIGLVYFTFIFKFKSGLKNKALRALSVYYSASKTKNTFYDVNITLYQNCPEGIYLPKASIAYNHYFFINKTNSEIIDTINSKSPYNIFLFESIEIAQKLSEHLNNVKAGSDIFNSAVLIFITLFFIFVKITLVKISWKQMKEIKSNKTALNPSEHILLQLSDDYQEETEKHFYYNPILSFLNRKNVFNYCIFHLTVILVLPYLYPEFSDFSINYYYGFTSNFFYSIYYSRNNIGQNEFESLSDIIITKDGKHSVNFILHRPIEKKMFQTKSSNPYLFNLAFLIVVVWIAEFFKPFETHKIKMFQMKKSKWITVRYFTVVVILVACWMFFMFFGIVNTGEYLVIFHMLVFKSWKKIGDVRILFSLSVFYYHIYFYVLMGIYTMQTKIKNKKAKTKYENNNNNNNNKVNPLII